MSEVRKDDREALVLTDLAEHDRALTEQPTCGLELADPGGDGADVAERARATPS